MTATPVKTTLEERVLEWTNTLCKALNNDYKRSYPDAHYDKFVLVILLLYFWFASCLFSLVFLSQALLFFGETLLGSF